DGHTEAAVELLTLAGLTPVAAIAEVVADDGEMMRLPGLIELGEQHGIPVITIERLVAFLDEHRDFVPQAPRQHVPESSRVTFEVETTVPTRFGSLTMR